METPRRPAAKAAPFVAALALLAGVFLHFAARKTPPPPAWTGPVDVGNLPDFLNAQQAVKDLPEDASLGLQIAGESNADSGDYAIHGPRVSPGVEPNPDIAITLRSNYLPLMATGFCSAIQRARAEGGLRFRLKIGSPALLWKYRGELGNKACFGY